MTTLKTFAIAVVSAAYLTACGGVGEPETTECMMYRAAWYETAGADDTALTGSEHAVLADRELQIIGESHAKLNGIDPARVVIGTWAQCE